MDSSQSSDPNSNDPNNSSNSSLNLIPTPSPPQPTQTPKLETNIICQHILSTPSFNNLSCEEVRYLKYNQKYTPKIHIIPQSNFNISNSNHLNLFTNKRPEPTFFYNPEEKIIYKHIMATPNLQNLSCEELRHSTYKGKYYLANIGMNMTTLRDDQLTFKPRTGTSNVPKISFVWA